MIAVLASGQGSNFEALAQAFPHQVCAVLCNCPGAGVIERAQKHGVPVYLVPHADYDSRAKHEQELINVLHQLEQVSVVVLAGYMRLLSPYFFENFPLPGVPILNLHPAHLDQYKGAHAYEYAVAHKFPRWGLSVHHVIPKLDSGPLVASTEFPVFPYESISALKSRVQPHEHALLVTAVQRFLKPHL